MNDNTRILMLAFMILGSLAFAIFGIITLWRKKVAVTKVKQRQAYTEINISNAIGDKVQSIQDAQKEDSKWYNAICGCIELIENRNGFTVTEHNNSVHLVCDACQKHTHMINFAQQGHRY